MKTHSLKKMLAAAFALLVFHLPAMGEDIDLFVGLPPAAADAPNVLIVLDNTANWNTAFTNEREALVNVVNGLPADKFRVGLMLFTETGSGNSGNDGAYLRAAVRPMDSANKTKYQALVSGLEQTDDKGNAGKVGKAMEEAYLYYAGLAPHAGNNKNKTDYTGNASGTVSSNAIYALSGNALAAKAGTSYVTPVVSGSCAKNYIIYISNGAAQDNASDISQATTALTAVGGSTTTIPISPSGSQDNVADEWARFMKKSTLGIVTYTVDINKVTTGQGPGWTALLKSMANVSSGKYFDIASSGTQIVDALNSIFSEIQTVNSVFASVSLPVSVNTQGTYLNQVYIGMFRPDAKSYPRWSGNLKQYKLGMVSGTLKLLDANSSSAINSQTGFITECARSFWTPSTVDTYWSFRPQGTCLTVANSDVSNYPDGNIVEKGAQAYMLRSTTTRTVKTCNSTFASCTALTDFNNTNVTQTMLGAASTTERDAIINWTKGLDLPQPTPNPDGLDFDENSNGITLTEMRPSAHGDVVHSRPVAINYGTDALPQVVVYYGGNDGILRAVNGNRSASIGSAIAGSELWSFVAPEFYTNLKRIRDNKVTISFPGQATASPTPLPKPYAFDGPIAAYKNGSNAWIYATMRRGGRVLYAFDVTTPASPSLKWKIGCPNNFPVSGTVDDTGCTTGFAGIGQTWSQPKIIKASGYGEGATPMLIMGGGYDACEDVDSTTAACTSPKGNKIYVLDADTGALLNTLNTDRSVVADLTVVPDSAGLAKYAYVADMGGNLYRITMGSAAPASWTITKIASLGCDTVTTCTPNRKFMFAPDVVDDNGTYSLLLGSGDREKPLGSYTNASSVANHFFMVKDRPTDAAWLTSENATCGANVICINSLLPITTSVNPTQAQVDAKKGWYLGLVSTEQVVTSAITVFGVTTFSTHMPAVATPGTCSANLGETHVYNISYTNAASANGTGARYEIVVGGGLPPSPVAGMVTLDDGTTVPFLIGSKPDSPLEGSPPSSPVTAVQPKSRVYWYIQQ
ncbi:MAG: pilus assembly protein PilY [Betaproteobacteria bacterium CG2_30_59_46]|nr:MAG: pilus assembly protein PilY [Betaproteobacteria bacterium CG2_30_59_46]PIQ13928.1 MAG: pilus assembly protein PilY [Hydrogenophilales bacterium CG18_big_fil_WC_8_21_14_2_50_58_12]PIY00632.1 MAG: pilus assembly protein PilY [Hydrogenophilales bacterium CG_4_10_14_3_um_filter_58_23]PJB07087.1 MAG: pilus assembly protein PilY [Hydrogenophilales bacterium CG_4_9_14_3_um_filter_59_35]